MTTDELLTWQQTMQALGVSSPTLYAIVDTRQELTPATTLQFGKQQRRYFRAADVAALKRRREGEVDEAIGGAAQ